jgi:hypothetical protein
VKPKQSVGALIGRPHGEPPFQIREELKATDTTAWIGKMNNVRNRAAEVVSEEIIYK